MKNILLFFVVAICLVAFSYGCWKAERWVNWKFSYGNKVETRIEKLEKRVLKLETATPQAGE